MIAKIIISLIFYFFSFKVFAAEENGGMPQLNPETFSSQLFWLGIFFILMFIIIHYLFLPKLEKVRSLRKETIDKYTFEAREIKDSITQIVEKIDTELNVAKEEYDSHIKKVYEDNRKVYENTLRDLNEKIEKKKLTHIKSLSKNELSIRNNLPEICVDLSNRLYENIMKEKISSNINEFKKFDKDG